MAINKVVYGNQTLIDLTTDTVASSDDILAGKVGHLRDGTVVTGTASGGDQHGTIWQDGEGYVHLDDESGIALQSKTATPTESQQVIEADTGYYALDKVTVGAISTTYVGSGIARRSASDLLAEANAVIVPAGYYERVANKAVATGTAGTPTATKGSVSNHAVTVTPSVTNTTGYISGGTKTGTGVSVSASELVSGTYSVTSSGTKDVTNYASASVPAGTAGTPTATKGTVSNHSVSVTPSVTNTAGYISGGTKTGTAVTVTASELASGTKTITENGTGIDVTGYASVDVTVATSTQHTATISRNDGQTVPYANVNSTGTRYQNNGQTFTWTDGDTIDFYLGGSGYSSIVYVNGVQIYVSGTGGHYIYTPPSCDISLEFSRNTLSEISYVYITYDPSENDFLITFTKNQNDEWMPDCTYAQASTAFSDGKTVVGRTNGSETVYVRFVPDMDFIDYTVYEPFDEYVSSSISNIGVTATTYGWSSSSIYENYSYVTYDASGTDAVPSDVANGKMFVNSQGMQIGTASGGGGSSYELIASTTYVVNTSSTTAIDVGTFQTGDTSIWTSDKMLYVKIRDTAGRRNGYYYGSDCMFTNSVPGNNLSSTSNYLVHGTSYYQNSAGYLINFTLQRTVSTSPTQGYGVYATHVNDDGSINISARYNSSSTLTINGTFKVDVYLLDWPGGVSPFNG